MNVYFQIRRGPAMQVVDARIHTRLLTEAESDAGWRSVTGIEDARSQRAAIAALLVEVADLFAETDLSGFPEPLREAVAQHDAALDSVMALIPPGTAPVKDRGVA